MTVPNVNNQSPDRSTKRRPFATWVKQRLTNLKSSDVQNAKKNGKKTDGARSKNNPYPQSGYVRPKPAAADTVSLGEPSYMSTDPSRANSSGAPSISASEHGHGGASHSNKSNAPTVETNPETVHSDAGHSRAFTAKTGGAVSSMDGAVNSTFSSPNQSEHSLTTTLTTIHSTSPGVILGNQAAAGSVNATSNVASNNNSVSFSQQFSPTGPVSALPPHLAPAGHPSTYSAATANNLLTDDASIMTLASSSKRRRRRSMDTDASVRALAPSSVWGGSRESLPLSVLSSNTDIAPMAGPALTSQPGRPSIGGIASTERASVYSSHSVAAPALVSDRNSYYAASLKQSIRDKERDKDARSIDGRSMHRDVDDQKSVHGGKSLHDGVKGYESSIKSGAFSHARNDSNAGSISGIAGGPAPAPTSAPARAVDSLSRQNSTHRTDETDADTEKH
ncbi:hypothetical protein K461DRAFT_290564 [Myriangium duriaei CBS 260.36]|uniref:Uncharacterized protein n=1 Tax=Myriangium duriaei CBS 260.36 TaxID=1168546 RepID=A0A9P4J507_9PEZI|nr:hypothetical protein K461DRAFT_290564 [Myriangium duriaei CBS 260.36]